MEFYLNPTFSYNFNSIPYFFLFCIYVRFFFYITYLFLNYTNQHFYILKNEKKQYVVKNIVKSVNLAALSLYSLPSIVYPAFMYHKWDNNFIHIAGLFYSSNDFVALTYVDNLSLTTKNHHKVTVFLSFLALAIDFNTSSLGKMLFVYTLSSSNAFLVNYHLGSRFLFGKDETYDMKKKARNVYAFTLFLNWGWHIYWCLTNLNLLRIQHLIYFCVMYPVVKDDIVLLSWLCN